MALFAGGRLHERRILHRNCSTITGQRGWKRQPEGIATASGVSP